MGAYLSEPVTKKISSDESSKNVAFGASSMQGWRVSQEDAHNCCIDFDENVSLFAVYDGHGGHEVATYCANKLPEFIKQTEAYQKGDIRQALIDAFLGFDATLAKPEVIKVLKDIAGNSIDNKDKLDDESDVEENVMNLRQEAEMPLEQVMAKYLSENQVQAIGEKFGKKMAASSPYIRTRRTRERPGNSSGASCSSSSWSTNEADVSSSSQSCSSSGCPSEPSISDKHEKPNSPRSSEVEQILDSTTSNGEVSHDAAATESPSKSADMPDSSEDVKEKVSPSKTEESTEDNIEVNGSESKKKEDADNGRSSSDVSSSSSVENGEIDQQEGISSSSRRISKESCYRSLLQARIDASDDEDDDDDEENDETFDGLPESVSEDDTEDMEDEDDDEDSDQVDEDDYEEEEDEDSFTVTEEPGSDSGCTAVVAILKGQDLYVANAGDSRCVLCRNGEAVELSLDHKPEDEPEMKRIMAAGGKVTADGRVNGGLNLSRALGDHAYKQSTELPPQEQMISALPDVRHVTIDPKNDEFMVLACDGIWNFMSSSQVIKFVRERINTCENLSKICEQLFDQCLAPDTYGDGTGCDNMTAIIVKFQSPDSEEIKNNANDEKEIPISNKRPLSPTKPISDSDGAITNEQNDECKRAKVETV
ncbi:probable protein phosphatase CG10417 [Chelonus insularis]|uniref:probable protein phosphatase CG10417 n=1 Tax=Chelonus insularis TaxID=460826 RepID=UPI00158A1E6C|nr:probable protein phosphatase CG10417 [Chelonus insularis]